MDRHGILLDEILVEERYLHESLWWDEYPDFLVDTLVFLEDKRYQRHGWVDRYSMIRATRANIQAQTIVQWWSTIPMQLIRQQQGINQSRTIRRKLSEIYHARSLSLKFTKDQIGENYLNTTSLGSTVYGFASASRFYYGKELKTLTKWELIGLITLIKNPSRYDPFRFPDRFRQRYELLAKTLHDNQRINTTEYQQLINEQFTLRPASTHDTHDSRTPYITDYILSLDTDNRPLWWDMQLTIDYHLSQQIKKLAQQTINELRRRNVTDYGVIIVERETNELHVMLGGYDYFADQGQVNTTLSLNQPWSTIKPFTFLLAFKEIWYQPESMILDSPVQFTTDQWYPYTPQNFSLDFQWPMTMAQALAQSINIPALKLTQELGIDKLLTFLRQLWISSLTHDHTYYGLALTLWVGEVSLFELVRAYSIFSRDGELCDIIVSLWQQQNCKQIIEKQYTDMIVSILANRYERLGAFPLLGNLDFADRWVFLKSGTSRNFSDNRVVGFTKRYLIGVRVGNKDGSEMKGVSGASGAGDLFKRIVEFLEPRESDNNHDREQQTLIRSDKNHHADYVTITSPLPYSVFTIDPNKPRNIQSVELSFDTSYSYDQAIRSVNGKPIEWNFWQLQQGSYLFELILTQWEEIITNKSVQVRVE